MGLAGTELPCTLSYPQFSECFHVANWLNANFACVPKPYQACITKITVKCLMKPLANPKQMVKLLLIFILYTKEVLLYRTTKSS